MACYGLRSLSWRKLGRHDGPPLIDSLKHMTMEVFKNAVLEGRPEKGMPNYNTIKLVVDNIDNLYAFLKGRSDDAISPGRLYPVQK